MTSSTGLLRFRCPGCGAPLQSARADRFECSQDGSHFGLEDGIWRFLPQTDRDRWQGFLDLYSEVRRDEGWRGATENAYRRALPSVPATDPHYKIWQIRASSLRVLRRKTLAPLARSLSRPLLIADLGAGNGWLANRLADDHHRIAAVDLDDNRDDGLGAIRWYGHDSIVAVQASFERLPWIDGLFDVAVFNGSLHYAQDAETPLAEALRTLRAGGRLVILDTPFYRQQSSGDIMLAERNQDFRSRHHTISSVEHEGFLTRSRLEALGRKLGVRWHVRRPWYGLDWALRPMKNRLLRLREPARFLVVEGQRINEVSFPR